MTTWRTGVAYLAGALLGACLLLTCLGACGAPSTPDLSHAATQAAEALDDLRTALAQAPTALQPARTEAADAVAAARTKVAQAQTALAVALQTSGPRSRSTASATPLPSAAPTQAPLPWPTSSATAPSVPPPGRTEAQVVEVTDGDTIRVSIAGATYRLRYTGIDAPEAGVYLGNQASQANRALVEGRTVYLERDVLDTDRYDRLLRYVYLSDGTFVNAELVRQGYAVAKEYPPDTRYHALLLQAQDEAQAHAAGLWAATPVPTAATRAGAPPALGVGQVQITSIWFNGAINPREPDEYAVITNAGSTPVNLRGWRLNADDAGQDFIFPDWRLGPGESCRVYTNQVHPETCGFSFGSDGAVWANKGECGHLFDAGGVEVSRLCY